MESTELIKYLFPAEITQHFNIVRVREDKEDLIIELEEKNELPPGLNPTGYESKGFSPAVKIQDYPLRDRAVFLMVKRRKWLEKSTGKIIQRKWDLTVEGTKYTKDFGVFLKGLLR